MFGICLYSPQKEMNWGSILRVAYNFNVSFICTIKSRYKRQASDTPNVKKQIPIFHCYSIDNFKESYPKECILINLEYNNSRDLEKFIHPKNVVYVFGPENGNIPEELLKSGINLKISTNRCLNQAQCAGITLFHRHLQFFK